jgi:replication initiation and membrane attachment protein DnaB
LELMSKKGSKGKKRAGQKTKPIRKEKLPEWFTQETSEEAAVQEQDEEFEAEKAKLMAELEQYRERGSRVSMQG